MDCIVDHPQLGDPSYNLWFEVSFYFFKFNFKIVKGPLKNNKFFKVVFNTILRIYFYFFIAFFISLEGHKKIRAPRSNTAPFWRIVTTLNFKLNILFLKLSTDVNK